MSINLKKVIDAEIEGRSRTYSWRKTPAQATVAGIWFDVSMSPGNPPPQYYIGGIGTSTALKQSTDGGLYHGPSTLPATKYLKSLTVRASASTALPMNMVLMDYLMFYSFLDEGTTDPQIMNNTITLPRYVDGNGVQIMAISVAGRTGGQSFTVNYTNSDGVSNRNTIATIESSQSYNGVIVTSQTAVNSASGLFLPLQSGDSGVRSIESITMLGLDVGLIALVLVKPLIQIQIKEITAPYEKDFLLSSGALPIIQDDAYLNFVCVPNGTLAATVLFGDLKIIWI